MTPQSANTDEHSKEPVPELNPMFNPLLAQNMGRWAEVYFTHSPEEREQAVQELVRQLEQENKERKAQISNFPAPSVSQPNQRDQRSVHDQTAVCGGCGYENPVSQRFCGMCGVSLAPPTSTILERIPTAARQAAPETEGEPAWADAEDDQRDGRNDQQHYFFEDRRRDFEPEVEPPMFASAEPSYSFRVFLGLALAIVLGVLGYKEWHKGLNLSQGPQAPPVAAEQALPDHGTASKPEEGTNQAAVAPAKADDATTSAAKAENAAKETLPNNPPAATAKPRELASTEPAEATPVEKATLKRAAKTENIQSNGNGAEELAMAQRYLDGRNGRRDPSQAAQWLWRSIAKQNSQATMILADLYLRGDGIQKNCDQARILLDAAALKGQPGAATRLRNMQAFGCQ